jgi:sulfite exporter TauE/SafE
MAQVSHFKTLISSPFSTFTYNCGNVHSYILINLIVRLLSCEEGSSSAFAERLLSVYLPDQRKAPQATTGLIIQRQRE